MLRSSNICRAFRVIAVALTVVTCLPLLSADAAAREDAKIFTISGRIDDIKDVTRASGMSFTIKLRDITYEGEVREVRVEKQGNDRFRICVNLRKVTVTMRNAVIVGPSCGARCGTIKVVMGKNRDLRIVFDVANKSEGGTDQLVVVGTEFNLPGDNWHVGSPSWVKPWGFGMTQSRVVSGLRSGMIKNRKTFEEELIKVAPVIFAQVSDRIDINDATLVQLASK